MATLKRFGADPPYSSRLLDKDGLLALVWRPWFGDTTRAITLRIASYPYDPASIAAGATLRVNVPVQGARPGDFAVASFDQPDSGIALLAAVTAADVVTITFWNTTGGAIDLPSGVLRARVEINA
jgi:hypothetical protein